MLDLVQMSSASPVGPLRLVATPTALVGVYFAQHRNAPVIDAREVAHHPVLDQAIFELDEYFRGARTVFSTPLAPCGTPFQLAVWDALLAIPYGETRSYAQLARMVGRPKATRAVGATNGRNLLSLFIPCHRVIGASGRLTGYAGGLDAKSWLLSHEQRSAGAARASIAVRAGPQGGPECLATQRPTPDRTLALSRPLT